MDPGNTPLEETMGTLAQNSEEWKGTFMSDSPTMTDLPWQGRAHTDELHVPFVINQNRYSILDRSVENNGLLEADIRIRQGLICFASGTGNADRQISRDMRRTAGAVKDGRFLS